MRYLATLILSLMVICGATLEAAPQSQEKGAFLFPENAPQSGLNKLYGQQALADKLYKNAIRYFTLSLQEAKTARDREEATALLAKSYLLDNQSKQALQLVNDFLAKQTPPQNPQMRNLLLLTAGQANVEKGDYTTALNFLAPLLELPKEELGDLRAQTLTAIADAWNATGRWNDTLQILAPALEEANITSQDRIKLTWRILQAAVAQHEWETAKKAIADLEGMNLSNDEMISLKLLRICCNIGEGKLDDALAYYKENDLSNSIPDKKDEGKDKKDEEKKIAYNKQWWDALSTMATACQTKGLLKDAAALFGAACKVALTETDAIAAAKNQVEALVTTNALPEAKAVLLELHEKYPEDVSITLRLAELRQALNERRSAIELYNSIALDQALEKSLRYNAAVNAAQCQAQEGLTDDAAKTFRLAETLTDSPKDQATVLRFAAEQNEKLGRLDEAIALFIEVADRFGENVPEALEARLEAGRLLTKQQKNDDAIEQFQKFLSVCPEDSPLRWTARIAMGKATRDSSAAIAALLQVARECPDTKISCDAFMEAHARALALGGETGLRQALDILKEFLERHPDVDPDQIRRVRLKNIILGFQLGNPDALAWGKKFIEDYAETVEAPEVALRIGDWHASENDFTKAIDFYRKVASFVHATSELKALALYEEAECSAQCPTVTITEITTDAEGKETVVDKSVDGKTRALDLLQKISDWTNTPALLARTGFLKGDILVELGKSEEALETYRQAREKAGQSPLGYALLGRMAELSYAMGRTNEARGYVAEIRKNNAAGDASLNARATLILARCLRKENKFPEAESLFQQIIVEYETTRRNAPQESASPHVYVNANKELLELLKERNDTKTAEAIRERYEKFNKNGTLPKLP